MKSSWFARGTAALICGACIGTSCPSTPAPTPTPGRDPLPPTRPAGLPNSRARWQATNLKFFISNFSAKLSQERQTQLTTDAFNRWSAVTPLNFTQVFTRTGADFVIGYGTGTHCELYVNVTCPADGGFEATTLGHAYFPLGPNQGQCHMNESQNWANERLLFSTLVHELGHGLGLEHLPDNTAVMFASDNGQSGDLTPADITAIQQLYGSRDGTVRPTAPTQPPSTDGSANRTAPVPTQQDSDGDGIDNATEKYVFGTDPQNNDSDFDGVADGIECVNRLDPRNSDTDGDGAFDGAEFNGGGNAFRPDSGLSGDVTPFVGKYAGVDSVGTPIEFTVAADGTVSGKISVTQYGFAQDYELIGAAGGNGVVEMITYDYFFEYRGTIVGTTVGDGTFKTDVGSSGTWSATKVPGKLKLPDIGARAFEQIEDGSGGYVLRPLRRPDMALYVPRRP